MLAALLIIVAMIILGEYTKTRGRLLLTFLVLASFCLSAIPPSALLGRGQLQPVGWAGLVASGAGCILVAAGIWATPDADAYWKTTAIVSIAAAATFQTSWMLLLTPGRVFALLVLWPVMGAWLLAALLSVAGIIGEIKAAAYWWVVCLLVLAAFAGTITLLARGRRPDADAAGRE